MHSSTKDKSNFSSNCT